MEPFRVAELVEVLGGRLAAGSSEISLTGVTTDSRAVCAGDLFVALRGPNFDGNQFASAAFESGACAALVESGRGAKMARPGKTIVEVEDTGRALVQLARWYRRRFPVPAVSITGSCGKTTTKEILAHLLSQRFRVVRSAKSFNNAIGVPLTIFALDRKTELAVFEIGTNAPGEIALLTDLTMPMGGVITNVHESHLQGLNSVEGVFAEKTALFEALPADGFAVINADDPRAAAFRAKTKASVVTVSCHADADLRATDVLFSGLGASFKLNGKYPVTLPLLGTHNIYNTLQALGACMALGVDLPGILEGLETVPIASHRLERKRFGAIEVLDDCYNSNPGSARAAIRALQGIRGARRKLLVLGDMLELGDRSAELHFSIGAEAAGASFDLFLGVGPEAQQMVKGALAAGLSPSKVMWFPDTKSAVAGLPELLNPEDLVLIKGSRRLALETIVDALADRFSSSKTASTAEQTEKAAVA